MNPTTAPADTRTAAPARRAAWRSLAGLALLLATGYAGTVGWLWLRQEGVLFYPEPLPSGHRFELGDDVHELSIAVPGASLSALHLRLPDPKGVVFYLHGNAGNLAGWFSNAAFYREAGYDLFMIDYRGYGKSSGRIDSEAQLRDDVRIAWRTIADRYAGKRRVILGRSLGSALAAGLAAEVHPELTVLVSPYRSMRALAAEHYPWVPGVALRYPLRTEDDAARLSGALLLLHGDRDGVIAVHHSEAILGRVPRAKLLRIEGAGHNDLHLHEAYRAGLRQALDGL